MSSLGTSQVLRSRDGAAGEEAAMYEVGREASID